MDNNNQKPNSPSFNKWQLVSLAFELGFIIALPLIALGLLGKWLDAKSDSYPLFTMIGVVVAIISTTTWLTKRFKELIK